MSDHANIASIIIFAQAEVKGLNSVLLQLPCRSVKPDL